MTRRQLFRIGSHAFDLLHDMSNEDYEQMVDDFKEMGLFHLPFDIIDVEISKDFLAPPAGSDPIAGRVVIKQFVDKIVIYGLTETDCEGYEVVFKDRRLQREYEMWRKSTDPLTLRSRDMETEVNSARAREMLIILLGTLNIDKEITHYPKPAKSRKHISNRYEYVTTIRGHTLCESKGETGMKKATHLRRGHIRRQKYGPGFAFERKIWIAPVLVNADEEFLSERKAYNVSL